MIEEQPPVRGHDARGTAVLMATTFAAAVAFVGAAVAIGGLIAGGSPRAVGGLKGGVLARVENEVVDIDTVLVDREGLAAGTGMVLTPSGEVLTNNHVIQQAQTITATDVGNGQTYNVRVIGYDERHDVAMLKLIGASGLQSVSLGNSTGVGVGTRVVTIGNAGGLGGAPTVRPGTVIARDRAISVADDLDSTSEHLARLLEIRGDLQPGDSGGPMIDGSGTVVGLDTAASESYHLATGTGLGFAIEINPVEQIANAILAGRGSSTIHIGLTAFIGVQIQPSPYAGPLGAPIEGAVNPSPAFTLGLSAGDVITALGGQSIDSPTALTDALVRYHPGERVMLSWLTAQGTQQSATITLADGPAA